MVKKVIASPGEALDEPTQGFMESRFGHDFSAVRIHRGSVADNDSANALAALAYTVGKHVVFAAGQYSPWSDTGRLTLAHELSHVIQQERGPVDGRPMPDGLRVSHPSDPFERNAKSTARRVVNTATDRSSRQGQTTGLTAASMGNGADADDMRIDIRSNSLGGNQEVGRIGTETTGGISSMNLQRDEVPEKELSTASKAKQLRIVFYQQGVSESSGFKAYADTLAANLGAIKLPYGACMPDANSIGSIPCATPESVLVRAANYAKCMGQQVEQVHVVGHVYPKAGPACLSGGLDAASATQYAAEAKVVVHGCKGISRFGQGIASVLKQLPNAAVYVHKASAEAGGPLDFYKVTADPASVEPKTIATSIPNVTAEGIGFTEASISQWASDQLAGLKLAVKTNDRVVLKNVKEWLTLAVFSSNETAVLADTLLADSSGLVPRNIMEAAENFKKNWKPQQVTTP